MIICLDDSNGDIVIKHRKGTRVEVYENWYSTIPLAVIDASVLPQLIGGLTLANKALVDKVNTKKEWDKLIAWNQMVAKNEQPA